MADTGFLNPAATGIVYNEWSNPTNAYASNDSYASSESGSSRDEQDYYNFSPTIPAGSSILGIIVSIEGLPNVAKQPNFRVKLSWNAGSSWTATKDTGAYSSEGYKEVGGSTELWGRTWTIAELGNTNFRIHVENVGDSAVAAYPCCDHIRIKIFHTEPLQGTVAAQSNVTGSMKDTIVITGTIAAQSNVTGIMKDAVAVAGTVAAQSNVSGTVSIETVNQVILHGVVAGQSDVTGLAEATRSIDGDVAAQSSVIGAVTAAMDVTGTVTGESNVSGSVSVQLQEVTLQGMLAAQSSVTGIAKAIMAVAGRIIVESNVSAGLATPITVITENDFIKLKYLSSGAWATIELDADEVDSIEIMPQIFNDMQRLQNNLPVIYKKPDAKLIILNLYSNAIVDVEALKAVSDIMYLKIYRKATLLSSYAVKLDRESCKTFGYFGGVPKDKNLQIAFYETESGHACLENQFNGVIY